MLFQRVAQGVTHCRRMPVSPIFQRGYPLYRHRMPQPIDRTPAERQADTRCRLLLCVSCIHCRKERGFRLLTLFSLHRSAFRVSQCASDRSIPEISVLFY